uniref:Uncharacterized protein n=1 Tax=Romanomermis culicivorax TaxID=13658 RepID=A0A915KFJ3_ROMCU
MVISAKRQTKYPQFSPSVEGCRLKCARFLLIIEYSRVCSGDGNPSDTYGAIELRKSLYTLHYAI